MGEEYRLAREGIIALRPGELVCYGSGRYLLVSGVDLGRMVVSGTLLEPPENLGVNSLPIDEMIGRAYQVAARVDRADFRLIQKKGF